MPFNAHVPIYLYQGVETPRPERTFYDYVLARQGVVKRLETWHSSADTLLAPFGDELRGLGLLDYPLQPLYFKLPRIPGQLLRDVLADARTNTALEFMYHFRYTLPHGWFVSVPDLKLQTGVKVRYHYRAEDQPGIVVDLHSHNTMDSFYSPTDNRDEQADRYYVVIGKVHQPRPEITVRLGMYGSWLYNIPPHLLFEDTSPFIEAWLSADDQAHYYYQERGSPLGPSLSGGFSVKNFFSKFWPR